LGLSDLSRSEKKIPPQRFWTKTTLFAKKAVKKAGRIPASFCLSLCYLKESRSEKGLEDRNAEAEPSDKERVHFGFSFIERTAEAIRVAMDFDIASGSSAELDCPICLLAGKSNQLGRDW